jgi:hypothetical protein
MDPWLTDDVKHMLARPCLAAAGQIGRRLTDRLRRAQAIDERALTEDLVDLFDTGSQANVWGSVLAELRDRSIYLNASVRKSTVEHRSGADIGFVLTRSIYGADGGSEATYACLVQCKRVDADGGISAFFHEVGQEKTKQSTLMLDITSSSFYFIYVPPPLVTHYCTFEPLAFLRAGSNCSVPIWNIGAFPFEGQAPPFLSSRDKEDATGVLVAPALAVEAQRRPGKSASLAQVLPNSFPFWYWFSELFVPAFVGDRRSDVVAIARNARVKGDRDHLQANLPFGVRYVVEVSLGNG